MKKTETAEWEDKLLFALNQRSELDDFTKEELEAGLKELPLHVVEMRQKDLQMQIEWIRFGFTLVAREGWGVPKCPRCVKFFIAKRGTPLHCPACAKKLRQRKWRERYEKEQGHPYQQKREPMYVKKIRKLLERRPRFKPTLENKRSLAADANVNMEQCETALEIILETKRKGEK
ncbi:MAG: hypothetical protein ND866_18385 [Pyrinomonadaceae bacterium]|nr:hypothetical protein [Pyrinomonadaceae bacterium]